MSEGGKEGNTAHRFSRFIVPSLILKKKCSFYLVIEQENHDLHFTVYVVHFRRCHVSCTITFLLPSCAGVGQALGQGVREAWCAMDFLLLTLGFRSDPSSSLYQIIYHIVL